MQILREGDWESGSGRGTKGDCGLSNAAPQDKRKNKRLIFNRV